MHKNRQRETKQVFTKRKIGKHLVNIAMLGLTLTPAVSAISSVYAEEAANDATASTDVSAQLKAAIEKAKSLGIKVDSTEKKTFQSTAELNDFNAKQLAQLNDAIAKAEKNVSTSKADEEEYNKAKAEYDKKKADYDTKKAAYDKSKAEYDAAKTKYDADLKTYEAAKTKYDADLKTYESAKTKYDSDLKAYESSNASNKKAKEDYDKKKAEYDTAKAKYDADLKAYEAAKTKYDADLKAYEAAKAESEKVKEKTLTMSFTDVPDNVTMNPEKTVVKDLTSSTNLTADMKAAEDEFAALKSKVETAINDAKAKKANEISPQIKQLITEEYDKIKKLVDAQNALGNAFGAVFKLRETPVKSSNVTDATIRDLYAKANAELEKVKVENVQYDDGTSMVGSKKQFDEAVLMFNQVTKSEADKKIEEAKKLGKNVKYLDIDITKIEGFDKASKSTVFTDKPTDNLTADPDVKAWVLKIWDAIIQADKLSKSGKPGETVNFLGKQITYLSDSDYNAKLQEFNAKVENIQPQLDAFNAERAKRIIDLTKADLSSSLGRSSASRQIMNENNMQFSKSSDSVKFLNTQAYSTLDEASKLGLDTNNSAYSESSNPVENTLAKIKYYAVKIPKGQSVTVEYSRKDGQSYRAASERLQELQYVSKSDFNSKSTFTDSDGKSVDKIKYTITNDGSINNGEDLIVYFMNDTAIPAYLGISNQSTKPGTRRFVQMSDARQLYGITSTTTLIGSDGNAVLPVVRQMESEYPDKTDPSTFVVKFGKTYVKPNLTPVDQSKIEEAVYQKGAGSDISEHGTQFGGTYESVDNLSLPSNWKDTNAYISDQSGWKDDSIVTIHKSYGKDLVAKSTSSSATDLNSIASVETAFFINSYLKELNHFNIPQFNYMKSSNDYLIPRITYQVEHTIDVPIAGATSNPTPPVEITPTKMVIKYKEQKELTAPTAPTKPTQPTPPTPLVIPDTPKPEEPKKPTEPTKPTEPKAPTAPVEPTAPVKKTTNNSDPISVKIAEASLVITKHIDITTGKELHPQEEGTKPKRSFDGYEFVETKTKDGNTIHYYKPVDKTPIKPKEDKAITKHFDITTGKEIAPQEDGNQPKKDIPNYEFVETKTKTGETDHYYKPISKPITRHIDKDTGKDIVPPEDGNKPKKDIPGYRFVETKDKDGNTYHYYQKVHTRHYDITTGKELLPQEDGTQPKKDIPNYEFVETKDKDGDTEHFYRPIKKVYTKHIDKKTGKELVPQEDGKQPKKDIPGYRFVETKDEDGNTIHYYEQVITKHLEVGTNKELAPQEDGQQPKKDIEGYEFVETKDDNGDTIHFYKPVKKVYTKHIDKSTGKELAPQEDGKQPKREFDGYKFVETKDEDGNTIHYYEPIAKVITKHIDIDTNEEIAPQEDGKQPKKDISDYEFVETKDDNGNTLHYYRKVKKPAAIKGKTPAKYADTNEAAGIVQSVIGALGLTSLAGFSFLKKRKK